jgi:hypothetical protein
MAPFPSLGPMLSAPRLYRLIADIGWIARRRVPAGLAPGGAPLPAVAAVRGQVVQARAAAWVGSDALRDHLLAELGIAESIGAHR